MSSEPGAPARRESSARSDSTKTGKSRSSRSKSGRSSRGRSRNAKSSPAGSSRKALRIAVPERPIALVGLMGVGKTTIGRRLAKRLGWDHFDSDHEIETASGRTVAGYFRDHGEADFRSGERRVIERLLRENPKMVLSTGGGAFVPEETRKLLLAEATVIWLKGDLDTLMERVARGDMRTRPLLQVADPRAKMKELMDARYPLYGEAQIHVPIAKGPHMRTVNRVIKALATEAKKTEAKKDASA